MHPGIAADPRSPGLRGPSPLAEGFPTLVVRPLGLFPPALWRSDNPTAAAPRISVFKVERERRERRPPLFSALRPLR